MTRPLWGAAARSVGGLALVLTLLVGTGAGLFHMGRALAGTSGRRADMLAAGLDTLAVGTAKQVERAERERPPEP